MCREVGEKSVEKLLHRPLPVRKFSVSGAATTLRAKCVDYWSLFYHSCSKCVISRAYPAADKRNQRDGDWKKRADSSVMICGNTHTLSEFHRSNRILGVGIDFSLDGFLLRPVGVVAVTAFGNDFCKHREWCVLRQREFFFPFVVLRPFSTYRSVLHHHLQDITNGERG